MTTTDRDTLITDNWPLIRFHGRRVAAACPGYERDDAAQDLASACLRRFDSFDPDRGSFRSWLWWVARTLVSNWHDVRKMQKRQGRTRSLSHPDTAEAAGNTADPRQPDPADAVAEAEHSERVGGRLRAAVVNLPPSRRRAIVEAFGLDGGGTRRGNRGDQRRKRDKAAGLAQLRAKLSTKPEAA